ncbi:MAG: hypothetical protein GWP10_09485 [Nitrospiraceae bacterium]|nr:hypothetical protein [Nitrospiraceae bacterium]
MKDKQYFNIIIEHKMNVVRAGIKIANALFNKDQKLAKKILLNCFSHDNRKVKIAIEFIHLRTMHSEKFRKALDSHRKSSKHHIQYWDDVKDMPLDIVAEMVCDWYARSCEMGTSLRDYVDKMIDTVNFSKKQKNMINRCVAILLQPPFEEVDNV